jgi:adenine-specific DNA-methyltransferase
MKYLIEVNFIATLPWRGRGGRQDVEHISDIHEFILLYAKERSSFEAGADIKLMKIIINSIVRKSEKIKTNF